MGKFFYVLTAVLFLCLNGYSQATPQSQDSAKAIPDSILSIVNLNSSLGDSATINDIIVIKIRTQRSFLDFDTLYVNGIKVEGTRPWKKNTRDSTVFFQLDGNVQNVMTSFFIQNKSAEKNVIPVYFSVAGKNRGWAKTSQYFYLEVKQKSNTYLIWIIELAILVIAVVAVRKNVLKDDNNLYYSLSRVQLFYWTLVIVYCYLILSSHTEIIPDIPASVITILGISLGTTALGKVIDNNSKDKVAIDPNAKSEGLLNDILSDGTSINIQRFQTVIFNLVFGLVFIQRTLSTWKLPAFDDNVLLLLGISSGAYAGLKTTEATKDQNKPLPQVATDTPKEREKPKETGTPKETETPKENEKPTDDQVKNQ